MVTTPVARIGLPLAVTLVLASATKRTTAKSLLVHILVSRETMAGVPVVCTENADAHPKRHECRYITQGTFTTSRVCVIANADLRMALASLSRPSK